MKTTGNHKAVILFTRFPVAGKVKTRLISVLGEQGAADLHKKMTEQILRQIQPAVQTFGMQLFVYYYGGSQSQMTDWMGEKALFCSQKGNDLGQRMQHALNQTINQGAEQILLIGSDCPAIDDAIITQGFNALQNHDLTLGPAADGGYYLIGLRKNNKQRVPKNLFHKISWGTHTVLQQTVQQAEADGLSCQLLPQLHDIDRPEDLVHLNHHICS